MVQHTPTEWKEAFGGAMSQIYAVDREFFSRVVHVQLSGVLALCCLINLYLGNDVAVLSAKERMTSKKAAVHRFTGRVFQSCVIPWSLYLNYVLFVHGMINFVSILSYITYFHLLSWITCPSSSFNQFIVFFANNLPLFSFLYSNHHISPHNHLKRARLSILSTRLHQSSPP